MRLPCYAVLGSDSTLSMDISTGTAFSEWINQFNSIIDLSTYGYILPHLSRIEPNATMMQTQTPETPSNA